MSLLVLQVLFEVMYSTLTQYQEHCFHIQWIVCDVIIGIIIADFSGTRN